ncbi:hypothetical protein HYH03_016521 [Edaphochlamys debaryana]|uniref:Uncharacterized protein n=1 Tax=Edaphochlamys debaryana TaxID=47281 RepID=A0A836BQ67_9CHLO|nr:hypothetical protein HYH03_016521 [Edaphochlamys debaryana]|eukprot:KAG2484692.1 hypothetical protein HYH03_016521 [Edaphochlamys debaryana]
MTGATPFPASPAAPVSPPLLPLGIRAPSSQQRGLQGLQMPRCSGSQPPAIAAPAASGAPPNALDCYQRQRQRLASALVTGAEGVAAAASGTGAQAAEPSPKRQRRQAPSHLTVQVSASALSAAGSARTLPLDVSALQQQRAVDNPAAAVQAPAPAYQLPLQWGPSYRPPPYSCPQVSGLQGPLAQPSGWSFPAAPTVSSTSSILQTPSPSAAVDGSSPVPTPAASASPGASPSLAPTAGPAAAEELWWTQPEFLAYLSFLGERPQEQPQPHGGAEWLDQHLTAEWQEAGADPSGSLASAVTWAPHAGRGWIAAEAAPR